MMSLEFYCTTGSEDAATVQAGTFTWSRDERPVLEKCVHACMYVALLCIHHLQHQSTHQAWSVGGSSGSCGSW